MASRETANAPLPKPMDPAPKPTVGWSARNPASSLEVQRYSRFVVIMKRALPMAAAALLAAVIAYSLQPRQQSSKKLALTLQKLQIVNNDLTMIKPRLSGNDSEGNPFVVTADRAVQDSHDSHRAHLDHVEADLTLKSGTWLNATSTMGELYSVAAPHGKTNQRLFAYGIVDVYSDNGYEMHTTAADIDMASGVIVGNRPANGQGPLGTFRSDRFRIERDSKMVYLYGHVHMTILSKHDVKHARAAQ